MYIFSCIVFYFSRLEFLTSDFAHLPITCAISVQTYINSEDYNKVFRSNYFLKSVFEKLIYYYYIITCKEKP